MKSIRWIALLVAVIAAGGIGFWIGRPSSDLPPGPSSSKAETLWTCSMHPQVLQDKPGSCPICGMQLTPVRKDPAPGDSDKNPGGPTVTIDPVVVQNIGVRVAAVEEGPLHLSIRTVGYLREAETHQHDISLKIDGWIERLHANTEGMHVKKGAPLFDLYSPDLLLAQEELLLAQRALERLPAGTDERTRLDAGELVDSARQKLALWNVPKAAIDEALRTGRARPTVTFRSPAEGTVVEKTVVQGSAVEAGVKLLRIVDLSVLWIDAQVYESQVPYIKIGQKARASVRGSPEADLEGEVVFLSPQVSAATRAATARLAVPNRDLHLKPGMFATVDFSVEASPRALLVPREAVIDTGARQVAFVVLGAGRFEPRRVRMGLETGDGRAQILAGLAPGERVVTSGQFLLDSESRLREAIQKMTAEKLLIPPAPPPAPGTRRSDGVVGPYLEMSGELAADRPVPPKSLDDFGEATRALGPDGESVGRAAAALRDANLKDQREAFKKLSVAMIDLVRRLPASRSVAEKLYVLHCPMAKADWLQRSETVANPYWGSEMLECGAVTQTIDTVRP
jgi:Cu(I)/Ag(I) efflux system membrane fusion protein